MFESAYLGGGGGGTSCFFIETWGALSIASLLFNDKGSLCGGGGIAIPPTLFLF